MTSAWRQRAFTYGIAIPFAIVLAFPFFWMAVTSLKPEAQVYDPTKVWSFHPTLASYGYLFHHTDYVRWLENSCFVGVLVVLITLVVALPAGYALARLSGRVGRSDGRRHLPHVPRPADAAVPAAVARRSRSTCT